MKKNILLILIGCTLMFACRKSAKNYTPNCSGNSKSFASDVTPVINATCATSTGCHAAGSGRGPGTLTNYSEVYNNRSSIRSSIVSGSMPQGSKLSDAQKNAIVCWIDNGAPNN